MAHVFLSHSHPDKPFARRLTADLRLHGHSVWIDEAEINIGDSLIDKIRDGLDQVDHVCAILSKASIESPWVQRELDIASNREIEERKVVVLPLILEEVDLPGFLKGKLYADFRSEDKYEEELSKLLRSLGSSNKAPEISNAELDNLRLELELAKNQANLYAKEIERTRSASFRSKSKELRNQIAHANQKYPLHETINNTYAFEAGGMPVTLDYLLWAIGKAHRKGAHPLEALISVDDRWDDVKMMLDAYSDLLAAQKQDIVAN